MSDPELCPRCQVNHYTPYSQKCGLDDPPYPALSRMDNKTYICSPCGTDEAMRDFFTASPVPPHEWPIKQESA